MSDTIADFLIRIKNANLAGVKEVVVPYSKMKESLAELLVKKGFLTGKKVVEENKKKNLVLSLPKRKEEFQNWEVKRISKPGRRFYVQAKDVIKFKRGTRLVVISSPQGLITGEEAIKKHLGGELICKII